MLLLLWHCPQLASKLGYLSNREQFVKINNKLSNILLIRTGSILGPLLFILYSNDLVNVNNNAQL